MPGNYNRIVLAGNVTRDPETQTIASGSTVCKFGLAVNRKRKDDEEVTFFNVVAWDKLAETCSTYLHKGSSILVEGRITIRKYNDKSGVERTAVECCINGKQMLDKKNDVVTTTGYYDEDSEIPI